MTCRPHYWISFSQHVKCGKCQLSIPYRHVDANVSRSIEASMRVQLGREAFNTFQDRHRTALAGGWATS